MSCSNRRIFIMQVAAGSSALAATAVMAQAPGPMVDPKDAQASALGYSADTSKVDAKKYPKHTADQKCATCQLYTGKPKDSAAPCPLFAGRQVAANGWCSAYAKKAA